MRNFPNIIGQTVTCHVTGLPFVAAVDGCTTNYARDSEGHVISDAGVDIIERRELSDRSRPFGCYLSGDGRHATGWKGNVLGSVITSSESRTGWHGSTLTHVRVRDCHGGHWYGKGAGRGMSILLRPTKG